MISSKVTDDKERLYYLEQHMVEGTKPYHIVASCLYREDGYAEARRLLQKRYGQPSTLASSYMKRIEDQKPIGNDDSDALDSFAILLTSCKMHWKGAI